MNIRSWSVVRYYDLYLGWIIPPGVEPLSEKVGIYKNLVILSLLALLIAPCFIAAYSFIDAPIMAWPLLMASAFMVGAPFIFKYTGSFAVARELFIAPLFAFKVYETLLFGGIISPGSCWFASASVAAILLGSIRSSIVWLIIAVGSLIGIQLVMGDNAIFIASPVKYPYFLYTFSVAGMFIALTIFVLIADSLRKSAIMKLEAANQKLEEANRTINELALRDSLTGIYNRRHVWNEIANHDKNVASKQGGFCICLMDLDRFKSINDSYGHMVGDMVLTTVAKTVENQIRQGDCFGRYGGEEFILLLKGAGIEDAWHFAEHIRKIIEDLTFPGPVTSLKVSLSLGLSEYRPGEAFSETISRADMALYAAKRAGRNCVSTEAVEA